MSKELKTKYKRIRSATSIRKESENKKRVRKQRKKGNGGRKAPKTSRCDCVFKGETAEQKGPLKVGAPYCEHGKRFLSYKMIKTDPGGWVDANLYLPLDYDLVYAKTDKEKTVVVWHASHRWDGLKYDPDSKVLYWKKKTDE